jgi:hypothetical protein
LAVKDSKKANLVSSKTAKSSKTQVKTSSAPKKALTVAPSKTSNKFVK